MNASSVATADVSFVGDATMKLLNASVIIRMNLLPCGVVVGSGPMKSRWQR